MKTKIFYYLHALVTLKPSQLFWYVNRRFLSDSKKDVVLDEQVKIRQGEVATAFLAYPMQASGPGYFRFL
ncbi:MAG: hypothetical protein KDJ38_20035, partial [Gammaproteobacteria bacterium]|nr:hypothetical protein [Gammaproteobacteria bacterium]